MILTIDTFAWAEMIRGSELASRAREAVDEADLCLTPSIVLAEVAAMCVRDGFEDHVVAAELESIRESSVIVPIDEKLAIAGAHAVAELRASARAKRIPLPGLADGLVLATARTTHSSLLSGDPHFRECPETVWLG
ncbi:MAG TPA: PIN domain-containing protein [Thermoplasmata archaeon]|nr:PIN domain-containing protein [Thermoplasmata archaeon]